MLFITLSSINQSRKIIQHNVKKEKLIKCKKESSKLRQKLDRLKFLSRFP